MKKLFLSLFLLITLLAVMVFGYFQLSNPNNRPLYTFRHFTNNYRGIFSRSSQLWRVYSKPHYVDLCSEAIDPRVKEIYLTHKDQLGLMLVSIRNNQPRFQISSPPTGFRGAHVSKFLEEMADHHILPDVDFVLCLEDKTGALGEIPVFSFAAPKPFVEDGSVLLFPDHQAMARHGKTFELIDPIIASTPWEERKETVFWRGAASNWTSRKKLVDLSKSHPNFDAAFVKSVPKEFENEYTVAPYVSLKDHIQYKYLIDVDGVTCTFARMPWIMYSKSVLIKHESEDVQWYYDQLQPYVHYIPIKKDWSDLDAKLEWIKTHDQDAKQIAINARAFTHQVFTRQGMETYIVKALWSYHDQFSPY